MNTDRPRTARNVLFSAMAAIFAGGASAGASAQGEAPDQAAGRDLEEITVTGSRIRTVSGFETPTPVTSLSTSELQTFEPGNTVSQQLKALPQFFGNRSSQDVATSKRYSPAANAYPFLNLRNLGGNRTLVLLDGHRLQPSDKDSTVNSDVLPMALMRSVDIVTGGASAAYGADAVGGVVNFILDREFEGLKLNAGAGRHASGVGDQWEFGAAGGASFLDDRLHVIGSAEIREIDQIYGHDYRVSNFRRWGWVRNPDWSPGANVPQRLTLPDVVSSQSSPTGLIRAPGTPLNNMQFNLEGTALEPFVFGDVVSLPGQQGGTSSMSGGPEAARAYETFDNSPVASGLESEAYFVGLKYDVTDRLALTLDGRWGSTTSINAMNRGSYELQSPFHMQIAPDNAFLPESVRQAMIDNNLSVLTVSKQGAYVGRPEVGHDTHIRNELEQYQVSGGFEFDIPGFEWRLSGHYQRGESHSKPNSENVIRIDRLFLAMDTVRDPATGQLVCRVQTVNPTVEQLRAAVEGKVSSVPLDPYLPPGIEGNTKPLESPIGLDNTIRDCVPLNPFGNGNMSAQALEYVATYKNTNSVVDQDFAEVLLTGDIFTLPAGPVGFAAGLTWRDQKFLDLATGGPGTGVGGKIVDVEELGPPLNAPELGIRGIPSSSAYADGSPNLHAFSTVPNIGGQADVWEWFAEVQVPVWESTVAQRRIDMNFAYRQSDYARSGVSDSWKVGGDFQLSEEWRLRLTRSRDIREPNFSELFDNQPGHSNVNDPMFNDALVITGSISGGNRTLAPEVGNTLTAGVVWQPDFAPWLDGLQVSLDWYDIEIDDRVDALSAQRIVDECYTNGLMCDKVVRNASGALVWVYAVAQNLAQARVKGTDLEVSWQTEPDFFDSQLESFSVRWLAAFLQESSTTAFEGQPLDAAGALNTPEYTHMLSVNYGIGPYSFQLMNRFVDSTILNINWIEGVHVDDNSIASMSWWNARIGYNGELSNGSTWNVGLNIQNVFDQEPPVVPGFGTRGGTQVFNNSFDVFGRRYNLSANYNF